MSDNHLELLRAYQARPDRGPIYGTQWGDPDEHPRLREVRDRFIRPYLDFDHTALEIGPGGGRWTRYLLGFRRLYAVEPYRELLDELATAFRAPHLVPVLNSGCDLPGIAAGSIDYVFSYSVFVILDPRLIAGYLRALFAATRDGANIVLNYADIRRPGAREEGQTDTDPARMHRLIEEAGFTIAEEDSALLPLGVVVRFRKP